MFSDIYNSGQTWLEAETFPQYSLRSNRQGFSQQERIGDAWPEKLVNIFWPKRLQLSTYLSKTLIVWQLIWKPDMKLVDAVIGLKICFEDENGKEINPKLGLMQPPGKKRLCLPMWLGIRGKETQGRDESSSIRVMITFVKAICHSSSWSGFSWAFFGCRKPMGRMLKPSCLAVCTWPALGHWEHQDEGRWWLFEDHLVGKTSSAISHNSSPG